LVAIIDIAILDTLLAVELTSNDDATELEPGKSLGFILTGEYQDGTFEEITANSNFRFESEETGIAEFTNNQLTIKSDAPVGSLNVFGQCNRQESQGFEITIVAPGS